MTGPCPPLTSVGLKFIGKHPQGRTGTASVAIGAVGEHATAPEAFVDEFGIGCVVDQMAGCGHLGAGLASRQVAARIGRSSVKLQRLQWEVLEVRHVGTETAMAIVPASIGGQTAKLGGAVKALW